MRIPRIMARAPGKEAGELDEVKVGVFADEFREAFFADVSEEERAERVYEIHRRVMADHEVYMAVATALGTRLKRAIRAYVDMYESRGRPTYEADFLPDR